MIKAAKNTAFESVFYIYIKRLLAKHFHKIHLKGKSNFNNAHNLPAIFYSNHSNWWDGFIALYLARHVWGFDSYLLMDLDQMRKYKFFRRLGVFSVDRSSASSAMESVNYAAELLKYSKRVLWIFPQGKMLPADTKLEFESGILKIAEKSGGVTLVPMALKYEFIAEQRPEIFINIGTPHVLDLSSPKNSQIQLLTSNVSNLYTDIGVSITNSTLSEFETVFTGKSSRNKSVDKFTGR